MKKKYLFMSAAAIMMAGCASDDLVGDATVSNGETPIAFSMNTPNATRTITNGTYTESDAATKLGSMFIVWGEKNEKDGTKATAANTVFQNYVVTYTASTANTTSSNTNNWEYVGIDHADFDTNVKSTIGAGKAQTIKYWDDNAESYTFTAVSALRSDIKDGKVIITKTESDGQTSSSADGVYAKGYSIDVKSGASTGNIYYADRVNIAKGNGYDHKAVQMTFRNFQSKIRFGIFETVPGYKVVITGIKYTGESNTEVEKKSTDTEKGFGVNGSFVVAGDNTKYTVTYVASGDDENKAQVSVADNSATQTYYSTTGNKWLSTSWTSTTENSCIGETSTGATFEDYTTILPNPSNTTNLKLQVKYELYSEDTGEKIEVGYKTVEVPAAYCQWKSNYAYTYLFKITDKSADLYPITFDACVVETETGNQETITTVSKPSITTYVKGKTASDEYAGSDVIYAYAQDGTVTKMTSTNMKLYKVTATDGFAITEASVKHALEHTNVTTKVKAEEITSGNDAPSYEAIPREDTGNRTITGMKWTAAAGTTYAIEYIKTTTASGEGSSSTTTKYYKIVKVASGS